MKSWFVGHPFQAKDRVIGRFDATPWRANFFMAVAFSKRVLRLIRAKNKRMQLCLQIEFAEKKSHSSPLGTQWMYVTKETKSLLWMLHKRFVFRPEIGPKHFDKLKPEPGTKPGPTYSSGGLMQRHQSLKIDVSPQTSTFSRDLGPDNWVISFRRYDLILCFDYRRLSNTSVTHGNDPNAVAYKAFLQTKLRRYIRWSS